MRYKLPKTSDRGRLIAKIGSIHFDILKIRRGGLQCEICGKKTSGIGRFHILRTATHPRLRFVDDNVLLACWMPCHNAWHHFGPNDPRNKRTMARIIELRGPDYEQKLLERERYVAKMDGLYLLALKETMLKELATLC